MNHKTIAVIGLGHGGLVAACKLQRMGFSVTVFEQKAVDTVGYPWYDDIRADVFDACGLPMPPRDCYTNKGKRLFISPDEQNSLRVPSGKPMEEISIDRRRLLQHLTDVCTQAGVTVRFETKVESLVVKNNRVCGVRVGGEAVPFDLVIDASGLFSPFRAMVPPLFGVQAQPGKDDYMTAWRGFFAWTPGTKAPDPDRNIYIKHQNSVGLSWCNLNDRGEVDVFVGRIGGLSPEEKDAAVQALYRNHDFFSDVPLRTGQWGHISLRGPLGCMVADGYCAVGDSAFMTMPMMGSGIEASMKAGLWLAQQIHANAVTDFTAANLWGWQVRYYKELGARYVFVDMVKRWVLGIDVDLLNWLFGCGAVTNEDMGLVSTDPDNSYRLTPGKLLQKAAIVLQKPALIRQTAAHMLRAAAAKRTAGSIPTTYDRVKIDRWLRRYNAFFAPNAR